MMIDSSVAWVFYERSEVPGSEERQDGNQREHPQEYAQEQELEGIEIIFADATSNESEMHDLILNANTALIAMEPISSLNDLPLVLEAVLAELAVVPLLRQSDAWVDEGRWDPGDIEVDGDEDGKVVEGHGDGVVGEVDDHEHGDDVDDQKGDDEEEVCLRWWIQLGPSTSKDPPLPWLPSTSM